MQRIAQISCGVVLVIAAFTQLGSCTSKPMQQPALQKPLAQIDIEHLGGSWRVTMTLPEPVDSFVFYSTPQLRIRQSWKLVEQHLWLKEDQSRDVVEGNAPFSKFTLIVPADSRLFPGAYSLTQEFGSEGWVLYTGHFLGGAAQSCPEGSQKQYPCGEQLRFNYSVKPQRDERLWWRGELTGAIGTWTTKESSDAFAYFGQLTPERHGQVQWLVPNEFPDWIERETKSALPKFIQMFTKGYGQPIEGDLKVIMNRVEGDNSFSASVLREFIQFELRGEHWLERNERGLAQLLETLAHETAHLWNGGRFKHDHSTGHNWLHEGGATAAASLLMREHGQAVEDFFATRSTQLNSCLVAADVPMREFGVRGRYPWYYSCGAIVELLIEGALRKKELDGFAHWRHMYSELEGNEYDIETYLSAVAVTTGDTELANWIRSWADQGLANSEVLAQMLRQQGLKIDEGPAPGDSMAVVGLLRPLMQEDCAGSFSISSRDGVVMLHGIPKCELSTEDFVVKSIVGFTMPDHVRKAYDLMQTQCKDGATIDVVGLVDEIEVARRYPCAKAPVHLKLAGWSTLRN